jgi:hypothetical protein
MNDRANENFKYVPEIEYCIYELIGGERSNERITRIYDEAVDAFASGCIVYEIHRVVAKSEWMNAQQTVSYEWHR